MKNLDPFKVNCPNKLQSWFLKTMSEELSEGMTIIFTDSLHQAEIPNGLHDALVSSFYKSEKSGKSNLENYGSISLTSVSCKLLEYLIHKNIVTEHLDHNNIIADTQHGFQSKRSFKISW